MTVVDELRSVSLADVEAAVPLRVREDRKHVVTVDAVPTLLKRLAATHAVLEIDGRRAFTYDTIYFDTPELDTVRAHVQRRRRRFKCRSRLYVETAVCAFEVKVRSPRGETVKHRLPYAPADHGRLTDGARAFLAEHAVGPNALGPALRTTYTRLTLAGPGERVTVDRDVVLGDARLGTGWAIVETKSERGAGLTDRELRRLGSRPVSLSKYVLGTGLSRMPVPPNDLRRVARRYFS